MKKVMLKSVEEILEVYHRADRIHFNNPKYPRIDDRHSFRPEIQNLSRGPFSVEREFFCKDEVGSNYIGTWHRGAFKKIFILSYTSNKYDKPVREIMIVPEECIIPMTIFNLDKILK